MSKGAVTAVIKRIVQIAPIVMIGICALIYLKFFRGVTIEHILEFTPENLWLAALVMVGLFALKSLSLFFSDACSYCGFGKYFPYVFVGFYCELYRRRGYDTDSIRSWTLCRKRVCGGAYKQEQKCREAPRAEVGQRAFHRVLFKGHKHSPMRSGKYVSRFGGLRVMEIYARFISRDTSRDNYHYPHGSKR